jgi:hypothetical protein
LEAAGRFDETSPAPARDGAASAGAFGGGVAFATGAF